MSEDNVTAPVDVEAAARFKKDIQTVISLIETQATTIKQLEQALAQGIAALGSVSVVCFDNPKSPLKHIGDRARNGLLAVCATLGDETYDRLAALATPSLLENDDADRG